MDKVENFISKGLSSVDDVAKLDIDALISSTHTRIKKRAVQRKFIYSSPVVVLLLLMVMAIFPNQGKDAPLHEGELFMAGWEYTWTETEENKLEDAREEELYEQSVDYLFDEPYYSYISDAEVLLDETDLEALVVYLKEA
ncbi:MAG: hypothetical protein HQ507_09235 [Candidatus Marinimicrobia bacterium]|nr:hypothetical protein [Candidatus Neomarinimicrobiota bacterium]